MGEVFLKLLNMSITAGWLIFAVLCVRFLFRKMPKWVNCVLWGVVAIRLIFPFSVESGFSLQPSAEPIKSNNTEEGEILPYMPSIDSNLPIVENAVNPILMEVFAYQESESVAPLQVITEVAGIVWICGMMILLAFALGSMVRLYHLVRESVRYEDNAYICDTVRSPFILGITRPRIYLSSDLSEDEIDYIIAHEKAHLRRKDHLWKPFGYLLLCIYWFNPLCWIAYIMLCKDIELACDEKVIKNMSFYDKKEYSKVLLSCATQRHLVVVCPLTFGEVGVKERVQSILNYKRPAFWITIVGIAACVIIAACFLTNPSEDSGPYYTDDTIDISSTDTILDSPTEETLVYVDRFDGTKLAFDRVEWVTVPSERATELNITEDDAPSGFSVYNEANIVEELVISDSCVCKILDWTNNYVQMDVTAEELVHILEERNGTYIPYYLTIDNNEIVEIAEQYVP